MQKIDTGCPSAQYTLLNKKSSSNSWWLLLFSMISSLYAFIHAQQLHMRILSACSDLPPIYAWHCGTRYNITSNGCIPLMGKELPCVLNIVITDACSINATTLLPHLQRNRTSMSLWYALTLVYTPQGYTWSIKEIAAEEQPIDLPDDTIIIGLPTETVDGMRWATGVHDNINSTTVVQSQGVIHIPSIKLKDSPTGADQEKLRKQIDATSADLLLYMNQYTKPPEKKDKSDEKGCVTMYIATQR